MEPFGYHFGNSETPITTPDISPNFSLSSAEYRSALANPAYLQNVTASIHYLGLMLTNGRISLETILEDVTINNVGKIRTVYEHFLNE